MKRNTIVVCFIFGTICLNASFFLWTYYYPSTIAPILLDFGDDDNNNDNEVPKVKAKAITTLTPPYRIIQLGTYRSGSTFQYELLSAIVSLKLSSASSTYNDNHPDSMANPTIQRFFLKPRDLKNGRFNRTMAAIRRKQHRHDHNNNNHNDDNDGHHHHHFVLKTHVHDDPGILDAYQNNEISLFASGTNILHGEEERLLIPSIASGISISPIYTQDRANLERCTDCEIDNYRDIFGLSDEDLLVLKEHMHGFEILRKCCGLQMSKYEMARLNGCNVERYKNRSGYPHCERYDLKEVELNFASPTTSTTKTIIDDGSSTAPNQKRITVDTINPVLNWAAPGDCLRFNAQVANGTGFNGAPFSGCDRFYKQNP